MLDNYEERIDNIEVMLGRLIMENDKAQRRQEKSFAQLEALIAHNEKRAEQEYQAWRERAEQDRQRAEQEYQAWRERVEQEHQAWQKRAEQIEKRAEQIEKRVEQDRKQWNKRWGELSNKMGTIVEDIVAPNIPRIAKELFGCEELDDFMIRRWVRHKQDRSKRREFDVIAVCEEKVIINETKSTVRIDYINQFLDVLPEIKDYFPEYAEKTIVPIFSSLNLNEDMVNYLTRHQIYAMAMGDETMVLLNRTKISRGN